MEIQKCYLPTYLPMDGLAVLSARDASQKYIYILNRTQQFNGKKWLKLGVKFWLKYLSM